MDKAKIGGAILTVLPSVFSVAFARIDAINPWFGFVLVLVAVVTLSGGIYLTWNGNAGLYRLRKVRDWNSIDQIPTFRLGRWAALIHGYRYPPAGFDPAGQPWEDTFFVLKRNIEGGAYTISNPDKRGDGTVRVSRDLLISRTDMRKIYEQHRPGERPRALFPKG